MHLGSQKRCSLTTACLGSHHDVTALDCKNCEHHWWSQRVWSSLTNRETLHSLGIGSSSFFLKLKLLETTRQTICSTAESQISTMTKPILESDWSLIAWLPCKGHCQKKTNFDPLEPKASTKKRNCRWGSPTFQHRRDAVLLHWRWDVVATPWIGAL